MRAQATKRFANETVDKTTRVGGINTAPDEAEQAHQKNFVHCSNGDGSANSNALVFWHAVRA